jgi:hypothetical protein
MSEVQGHLDMVCERLPVSPNDPAEGRIELLREGDLLTADGTTLGADNGIGIAAMMALAEDESSPHGPLELLMTVNEEVGGPGEGASGLDPSLVSGATLLNLDSEEDGKLTVGSASSTDTSIRVEKPREARGAGAVMLSVSVSGGLGGHSGTDIAHGRANAICRPPECLRSAPPIRSIRKSPAKKVREPTQRPRATAPFPPALLNASSTSSKADCADQETTPEGHYHAERPLSHTVTECKGSADDQGRGGDKAHANEVSIASNHRRSESHPAGMMSSRRQATTILPW